MALLLKFEKHKYAGPTLIQRTHKYGLLTILNRTQIWTSDYTS